MKKLSPRLFLVLLGLLAGGRSASAQPVGLGGAVDVFGRPLVWTPTGVYVIGTIDPCCTVTEVVAPGGASINATLGVTIVAGRPVLWTPDHVYVIGTIEPCCTVSEMPRPGGGAISGARGILDVLGRAVVWTPDHVYLAGTIDPCCAVAEVLTPGATPIVNARGAVDVIGRPFIWTPTNLYAVGTLEPCCTVAEVLAPGGGAMVGTRGITLVAGRPVVWTPGKVHVVNTVEPCCSVNEMLAPGIGSIAGAQGVVDVLGRAVVWNDGHVYVAGTIEPCCSVAEATSGGPIAGTRGVVSVAGRAVVWTPTSVHVIATIEPCCTVDPVTDPSGGPILDARGVLSDAGRAVIWTPGHVYVVGTIDPCCTVAEAPAPGGGPIVAARGVSVVGLRPVVWVPDHVYVIGTIEPCCTVAEALGPGGGPIVAARGIIDVLSRGLIWTPGHVHVLGTIDPCCTVTEALKPPGAPIFSYDPASMGVELALVCDRRVSGAGYTGDFGVPLQVVAAGPFAAANRLLAQAPSPGGVHTVVTPAIFATVLVGPDPVGGVLGGGAQPTATVNVFGTPLSGLQLTLSDSSVVEGNDGASVASFSVSLTAAAAVTVRVSYATTDGTATAGSDYGSASGTLTFAPGTTVRSVSVPVFGDQVFEGDETFGVNLSAPVNATILDAQGVGTILNDDAAGLSINDVTVAEGRTGTVSATFTVTLSPVNPGATVTLDYATASGTATAGLDFAPASGTLSFPPGAPTQTLSVVVNPDALVEGAERFAIDLSNAVNATIGSAQGKGTILDPWAGGDFNSDGKPDILWRHAVSGKIAVWLMDGTVRTAAAFTTPDQLADTNWQVAGTADFSADGKTDILWRHAGSGKNVVWLMDGLTRTAGVFTTPDQLADANWRMAGTGDFDVDGDADVLWRHGVSGKNVVWLMDGVTRTAGVFTTPDQLADTNWRMAGVGEFSGDGKHDVVWRHALSGKNVVWFMEGVNRRTGTFTAPDQLADTNWQIAGLGDFNLDEKPDLLWRQGVSGKVVVWLMDGVTRTAGVFTTPAQVADTHWKIVGPR